jgi:hypothetical protein
MLKGVTQLLIAEGPSCLQTSLLISSSLPHMLIRAKIVQLVQQSVVRLGFKSWQGQKIFPYSTASRLALGPGRHLIQLGLWALSLGVKQPGCKPDCSSPSSAKVKNG